MSPERDVVRDRWMRGAGFTVMRFTNTEVHENTEGLITAIRMKIEELRQG